MRGFRPRLSCLFTQSCRVINNRGHSGSGNPSLKIETLKMADQQFPAAVVAERERVDKAVTDLVTQLDKEMFRKMQVRMYQCSAKCCENQKSSMEAVQTCVQNCQQPVAQAQEYMQKELEDFMDRLQRCTLQCQDDVKDKLTPKSSQSEVEKAKSKLEGCLIQCGEKHVALIPGMAKRMKSNLARFYVVGL